FVSEESHPFLLLFASFLSFANCKLFSVEDTFPGRFVVFLSNPLPFTRNADQHRDLVNG
ncbi:hypothetical protein M2133_003062, partial [Parabacteroides sp. PF5-6]|nr:hypothetical protein [Parabacteroides sp. PF5-6]